jgi:N-acetylglucosamine malate deacetylase 1
MGAARVRGAGSRRRSPGVPFERRSDVEEGDEMRVVVVAPHPDDEVIGCGGSIARHVAAGDTVTVIVVIARERSFFDTGTSDAELAAELAEACRVLGVADYVHLDEASRDVRIDRRLVTTLAGHFRRIVPDVVYVPHAGEGDREHQLVGDLGLQALWMAREPFFPEAGPVQIPSPELVLGYEVWTPMAQFQHVVDISDQIEVKAAAMRAYASQTTIRDYESAIRGLGAYRGATTIGRGFAEVFTVLHLGDRPAVRATDR